MQLVMRADESVSRYIMMMTGSCLYATITMIHAQVDNDDGDSDTDSDSDRDGAIFRGCEEAGDLASGGA
jgi:hypothetical protein